MNDNGSPDEIESGFKRTLCAIRSALVLDCHLTREEAAKTEADLYVWFRRLVERRGISQLPIRRVRVLLLSTARQYGRSYRISTLQGASFGDALFPEERTKDITSDLRRSFGERVEK